MPASFPIAFIATLIVAGGAIAAPPVEESHAWATATDMGIGINIGNTLENTTAWETGWGNPPITREYVESIAALGFRTVRLPVAWDTYARDGIIAPEKMARVSEVVDWITGAGMYCVINIHWDGGWIDSSNKEKFASTYATFSADAERKYRAYWTQIARRFADRDGHVLFEALNEETNFEKAGSVKDAFATLTKVNQIFIDTVRQTGGNNADRLLIVSGYATDFTKTASADYVLPKDTAPHKLLISVHYYTPWQFVGMTEDASWGKMMPTWGTKADLAELEKLFDLMAEFSKRNDIPVFVGEYGASDKKETKSRVRWMSAVAKASLERRMVPVLWDTGGDVSRKKPYAPSVALIEVLKALPASRKADPQVTAVVEQVLSLAQARKGDRQCETVIPPGLNANQHADIALALMVDPLDVEQIGDDGVVCKWSVIDHSILKLSELPGGAPLITMIADDHGILVDGGISLTLCNAAVVRGREMLPLLEAMKNRRDWGMRCAGLIREGRKTAY